MGPSLLIVEDDDGIAAPLQRALAREGYEVSRAGTGEEALTHLRTRDPDMVILDLGLPDMDGLEVCREVRDRGLATPIMILTARGEELDRVVGLDAGADDYLAKPFGLAELLARTRALLRRSGAAVPGATPERGSAAGRLRVDEAAHRVWVGDEEVPLGGKEFGVLALLTRQPGTVVTREQFMDEVWDEHWFGSTKTLDVTLGRVRQKLEEHGAHERIVAVRGVGFRLEPADA